MGGCTGYTGNPKRHSSGFDRYQTQSVSWAAGCCIRCACVHAHRPAPARRASWGGRSAALLRAGAKRHGARGSQQPKRCLDAGQLLRGPHCHSRGQNVVALEALQQLLSTRAAGYPGGRSQGGARGGAAPWPCSKCDRRRRGRGGNSCNRGARRRSWLDACCRCRCRCRCCLEYRAEHGVGQRQMWLPQSRCPRRRPQRQRRRRLQRRDLERAVGLQRLWWGNSCSGCGCRDCAGQALGRERRPPGQRVRGRPERRCGPRGGRWERGQGRAGSWRKAGVDGRRG